MSKSATELILQLRTTLDSAGFIETAAGAGGITMHRTVDGISHTIRYGERRGKLHARLVLRDYDGLKFIDYRFGFATASGLSTLEFHLRNAQPIFIRFPLDEAGARRFSSLMDGELWEMKRGKLPAVTLGTGPGVGQTKRPGPGNSFTYVADVDTLCRIAEHITGEPLPDDRKAALEEALTGIAGAEPDPETPRWQLTFEAAMEFLTEAVSPVLTAHGQPLILVKSWSDRKNHAKP